MIVVALLIAVAAAAPQIGLAQPGLGGAGALLNQPGLFNLGT